MLRDSHDRLLRESVQQGIFADVLTRHMGVREAALPDAAPALLRVRHLLADRLADNLSLQQLADEAARAAWTETLLERLVALNAKRTAEEAAGTVRWLRPEFQDPARRAAAAAAAPAPQQAVIEGVTSAAKAAASNADEGDAAEAAAASAAAPAAQPWPPTLPEQVRAVAQLLAASPAPLALPAIEAAFKGKGPWKKGLPRILETLEALGRAQRTGGPGAGSGWRG